jgi:zinc protease
MSLEEAAAFHRGAYVPDRMTIIAVGALDHDLIVDAALRHFQRIPSVPGNGERTPAPPAPGGSAVPETGSASAGASAVPPPDRPLRPLTLVHRPGAAQSEIRIGQVAAARKTPDYHALLVLNLVLGGQFVSRINLNLRERRGYTYGARTSFEFRLGRGPFVMQAGVQTDATVVAIQEALDEIRAIGEERPTSDEELEFARAALTRGYPRGFETAEQIARALTQLALYELPDAYFSEFTSTVRRVQRDDVTEAARRYLRADRSAVVVVGDSAQVLESLTDSGLGPPAIVEGPGSLESP